MLRLIGNHRSSRNRIVILKHCGDIHFVVAGNPKATWHGRVEVANHHARFDHVPIGLVLADVVETGLAPEDLAVEVPISG